MSKQNFYVTTPIYYVNDKPHIGHSYTTILADVLARGHRLLGVDSFFLTGTDEHGLKVQQAAQKLNRSPIEHCDETVKRFQELWAKLGITYDYFIRTTEERHKKVVQEILQDLYDRDLIYAANYEGWYCVPCERFFTEKDLVDGKCPDCQRAVESLVEKNYFFKMSQYQQRLIDYINEHPDFIQPSHRRQETLGFLQKPLGDLCISRPKARLAWGIDLPFDKDYVTYVWFDALVNYISGVGYRTDEANFRRWWPASYHLIGKDILTTHTVYWPCMLMALELELPKTVFAHGWWLTQGAKMSKTAMQGQTAQERPSNPMDMIDKYGVDALRYYLMSAMSLGQDTEFSEEAFILKFNSELANDLGNLCSRTVKMLEKNFDSVLPPANEPGADEAALVAACQNAVAAMRCGIEHMQLDRGIAEVIAAVREGNRYFDAQKPWILVKEGKLEQLGSVLRHTAECLRIVSGLLYPVMPEKMLQLRRQLGVEEKKLVPNMDKLSQWNCLTAGVKLPCLEAPIFPRIEVKKEKPAAQVREKPQKASAPQPAAIAPNVIGIEDFAKLNLRTAEVISAERVPEADKLLCLQVRIGDEERQIVAGIAEFYKPEELPGKLIVIVANLKPRELRGLVSQGMLLAAKQGKKLSLITCDQPFVSGASVG
ncbi:MAG: methionine--tRNA ligase [Oligosphaeraceae bacterium]|nr:methionine--tRNA ligase [Oligosphaeraceae bacterium]